MGVEAQALFARQVQGLLGGGVDRSTAHDIFGGNRNSGLVAVSKPD